MKASEFAERLSKARATGNSRWTACCPAHDDQNPSLSVSEGDDGRVLIRCFAGCSIEDIVGAVGVSLSDIMPERAFGNHFKPIRRPFPAADVLECLRTESTIVWLAAATISNGGTLEPQDRERVGIAMQRIEAATYAGR